MIWHDFERNKQTAETCAEMKRSIAHTTLIKIDTTLSKNIIIFKICFSGSCLPSRATKQTSFGNFTRLQTYVGHPKPSGEF